MTHASLFSGIGGPEVAASMLGWDNLFHCEINEFGRRVLDYWFPNSKSYEDITKTDFSEWRGKVDVLTGGFPCQPFSYAGKRRGADDDRYLWPYMFKAIEAIRPAWIVAENVAGITTMVEQGEVFEMGGQASMFEEVDDIHRYRLEETFTLQRICDDLEGHGYSVQPVLVPACAVGAPHRRDRVFIIARRNDAVADTHNGDDQRNTREDEGESGKERLQERNKIREPGEPNQVRSKICKFVADISFMHLNGGQFGNRCDGSRQPQPEFGSRDCTENSGRFTSETESEQGGRCEPGQPRCRKSKQVEPGGRGGEDDTKLGFAYTNLQRREEQYVPSERIEKARFDCKTNNDKHIAGLGRWEAFPSVSPIHRGDDGIPFDVDRLAIPFSKWIKESLKAYGNAIVPQVMYEIFRFIEIVEEGGEE